MMMRRRRRGGRREDVMEESYWTKQLLKQEENHPTSHKTKIINAKKVFVNSVRMTRLLNPLLKPPFYTNPNIMHYKYGRH